MAPAPRRFREGAVPLRASVAAMLELSADGARSAVAGRWTAEAARAVGRSSDPLALARELVARVRGAVVYVPDEYGVEVVQHPDDTLEGRRGGDCDDSATAVAALLRRAGYRTGFGLYRDETGAPRHVVALLEHPLEAGRWVPAEAAEAVPFGELVPAPGWSVEVYAAQAPAGAGLGFLPQLVASAVGLAGSVIGSKAASKSAKEQRKGLEAQATAHRVAALEAAALERVRIASHERMLAQVVGAAQAAMPYVVGAAALSALPAVLGKKRRAA